MPLVYFTNLVVIGGYFIAFLIDRTWDFALPRQLFGSLFFLLPSINCVALLKKFFRIRLNTSVWFLLTIVLSVIIFPFLLYFIYSRGTALTEYRVIYYLAICCLLPIGLMHVKDLREQTFQLTLSAQIGLKDRLVRHRSLVWSLLAYFLIISVNFLLYRFIPEADGYNYLKHVEKFIQNSNVEGVGSRPLFTILMASFAIITKFTPYVLFKYVIPLGLGTLVIVNYFFLLNHDSKQKNSVILTLLPLTMPVIVMEILIPRPQSIILLLLPIILYFYYLAIKLRNHWLMFISLAVSFVTVLYHELGLFLIVLIPFMLLRYFWSDIRRNPPFAIGLIVYGLIGLYPYLANTNVFGLLMRYATLGWNSLSQGYFRWWFISNYTNVDGNMIGWPGYSWILYYGYNLGLVVPLIFIWAIRHKHPIISLRNYTGYYIMILMFFVVAEILPRFGLAFLPDRAWLFFEIAFVPLLILIAAQLVRRKKWRVAFVGLLVISVGSSFYVTYQKQGWITASEYSATQWINQTTEPNAIIAIQPGNNPLASYYMKREYYIPSAKKEDVISSLNTVAGNPKLVRSDYNQLIVKKTALLGDLQVAVSGLVNASNQVSAKVSQGRLDVAVSEIIKIQSQIDVYSDEKFNQDQPVYFLYSSDKDRGLYAQRAWWKIHNWYGFDTGAVDSTYSRVYDQDRVIVWKIK